MSEIIYPRSPKETMAGWVYLPRFVDKIRLHLAGRLHADYEQNFAKRGFDAQWLTAAGLDADAFISVVKGTCDELSNSRRLAICMNIAMSSSRVCLVMKSRTLPMATW